MIYQIEGFIFNQLSNKAKQRVIRWIDEYPMEYQNDNGETIYRYFADGSENDVGEHCEINGYIFNVFGEPIHHVIEKVEA
jgi:hypothetical protein